MATSITGQGIAAYKAPDDALSSESKNAVQNKVIDEELSDVKNAIDTIYAPFEFSIEQTVNDGYFTVSDGAVVKNTLSGYYAEITPEYVVKEGDAFTVSAASAASAIKTVFWMNKNKAVIATTGYTAPVGAWYVRFQTSNRTSVATLALSVEKETANLYRLSGSGSEKTGFVLEKTDSGAKFAKGRGCEEAESIFSLINSSISQITITEDSGYGWYFVNNVLTKLTGNYYVKYTNLIPVVAGMKFGIYAKTAGSAFQQVMMFTGNKKTSVPWSMDIGIGASVVGVVTVPDGVDYIMFQSTATTANPALDIEQLYPVNIDKKLLPLKGLKWAALGDSITNINSGYSPGYLKLFESFEGALITNLAISGSGFCVGANKFVNRISEIPEDTQIITVTGSFNDLNHQPSGGIGTVDDDDETTICGAMNVFFDALIEAFPTTTIACYMTGPWSYYKPETTTSDEYVEDLKTICRKKGIPFYDGLYYASNLRPWNAECCKKYYSREGYPRGDGVHPGSRGMRLIYHQLRSWIVSLVEERDGGLIGGVVPNWLTYYDS